KGLSLTAELSDQLGMMVSDQRRVEQILLNLLNNAIKFTDHGSVALAVEAVDADGEPDKRFVRFRVRDTGVGMKPEDTHKLFQPFRQLDDGLQRQHEGTGLGLAICRRLTELLGGSIGVESVLGQGSEFTVTWPVNGAK